MKIGNIDINNVKLGNTQIQKVMLGNTLIWEYFNLLEGLVAYYAFEYNANDNVNGYNGSLVGTPTFTSGKNNLGINFGNDNIKRYFEVADNDDFSFTNGTTDVPFSISAWVNFSAFNGTGNWFISKRGTISGTDEWQLVYYQNRLNFYKFQFNDNSIYQQIATSTTPFSLNTWYHICYTDSGNSLVGSGKLYINGVTNVDINQNAGGTYTRMNNGTRITRFGIDSWQARTDLKHRGLIDELGIWKNRELTPTEVLELYNSGLGKFYPF